MSNCNLDHMDEKDIKPPVRMPEIYWEMYLINNSNNKKRKTK